MHEKDSKRTRIRVTTDGRVGWPDVVQYELLAGPDKGRLLTCRPTVASHPDPETDRPPEINSFKSLMAWCAWRDRKASGECMAQFGLPYRIVIHDDPAYQHLWQTGQIDNPRHTGAGQATDHRAVPGAA